MEDNVLQEVLVPAIFFTSIVLIVYFILKARTKERLALIEKGVDPNLLVSRRSGSSPLKIGLLIAGVGLGAIIGFLMSAFSGIEKQKLIFLYPSLALFFGGLGLITYYIIESKNSKASQ